MTETLRRFTTFILVGGFSALIDVGLVGLLLYAHFPDMASVTIGFLAGVIANYILHAKVTFQVTSMTAGSITRYLTVLFINYLITVGIIQILSIVFETPTLVGKIISLPIIAIVGFTLSRYWVFRETNHRG